MPQKVAPKRTHTNAQTAQKNNFAMWPQILTTMRSYLEFLTQNALHRAQPPAKPSLCEVF